MDVDVDATAQRWSSAAASAPQQRCQKANDLARSGRLQRWVRRAGCRRARAALHDRTTSARNHAAQRAFGGTTPVRNHTGTTSAVWNHTRHGITRGTTSVPHHGRSYHTGITSVPHHGRSYHASTTRTRTTGPGTTGVHESRPMDTKKACRPRSPAAERPAHQRRERTAANVSKNL